MGTIGNPETSVANHGTLCNNPDDGRLHFNSGKSLKSRDLCVFLNAKTQLGDRGLKQGILSIAQSLLCYRIEIQFFVATGITVIISVSVQNLFFKYRVCTHYIYGTKRRQIQAVASLVTTNLIAM